MQHSNLEIAIWKIWTGQRSSSVFTNYDLPRSKQKSSKKWQTLKFFLDGIEEAKGLLESKWNDLLTPV